MIEPGFVATEALMRAEGMAPENMLKPGDVVEAALLPLQLGPDAVPLELRMNCMQSPFKNPV